MILPFPGVTPIEVPMGHHWSRQFESGKETLRPLHKFTTVAPVQGNLKVFNCSCLRIFVVA